MSRKPRRYGEASDEAWSQRADGKERELELEFESVGSATDDDYDDDDDLGCTPDTVDRQCTDVGWVLAFIVAIVVQCYVLQYCFQHGDLTRFRAFKDTHGEHCLRNATHDRFLYFCMTHAQTLNVQNPICVASCPNETHPKHSFACEEFGLYFNTSDYATEPYFGMLCRPTNATYREQVEEYIIQTRYQYVKGLIIGRKDTVLACLVMAVVASYVYLQFLGRCAGIVVWTGLVIAVVVPLACGLYFTGALSFLGLVPQPYRLLQQVNGNPMMGAFFVFIGLSFACCGLRMSEAVDKAMQCLEDSIACVLETPVLSWQPLVHLTISFITIGPTFAGIVFLSSCQDLTLAYKDGSTLVHLFLLRDLECAYMVFLVLFFFWIQQANFTVSTFTITYIAQLWYFMGGDAEAEGEWQVRNRALVQAYWAAYRYHFGSLLKAAVAVGLTRPIRLTMSLIVGFTEMKANAVGAVVSMACCCCISCFERWLEHLNQDAIIEIALNGRPFSRAAQAHQAVIDKEVDAKRILHGASRVFQWAGLVLIGGLGAVATCMLRLGEGHFDELTRRQLAFTKLTFLILGLVIAVGVCFPFMMLFDTIADTILYIRTVDKLRSLRQKQQQWDWTPNVLSSFCCMRPDGFSAYSGYPT